MTLTAKKPATKALQPDPAAKPEAPAEQGERITPALWMPAAPAIAWLAFSSAETDWDAKFYLGASIWYAADPGRVLEWLTEVIERGDLIEEFQPEDFRHLHRHVRDAAVQTESFRAAKAEWTAARANGRKPAPLTISDEHIREAASSLKRKLEGEQPAAQRDHDAIWEGSEKLRRALARGDLTACGWPGRGPDFSEDANPPLRELIPRDVFMRPVTVTQEGVFAFARGDGGIGYDFDVLWSGLLFDSADLLALHKPPEDGRTTKSYTPPEKPSRKGIGGRPDVYYWGDFDHALIRQLVSEALNLSRLKIRKDMKDWAAEKMGEHPPDDRTIERHIDRLVPGSVYVKK